jgi:hypothetical protein
MTVSQLKQAIAEQADLALQLTPSDIRLMFKGKLLQDDAAILHDVLLELSKKQKPQSVYHLMATGVSNKESQQLQEDLQHGLQTAPRVRDDLTSHGQKEMERRKRLGRIIMQQTSRRSGGVHNNESSDKYGFGQIETIPNLPRREEARRILETLANDPGILACMAKHKWHVGSLAELYPEGKVGESEVCVMGLNQNKGMRILLRVRTDDLQGFRKMLSIRKVLFHELAHNVHSEHDQKFFQLMRQIEKECNEMDWTQGAGLSTPDMGTTDSVFEGGTYRLGGGETSSASVNSNNPLSRREVLAQAALERMTAEEEEIQDNCGCGRQDLFLPPSQGDDSMKE